MALRGHYAAMLVLTIVGIVATAGSGPWAGLACIGLALVCLHAMWRAREYL